jgi:hypothetical protein
MSQTSGMASHISSPQISLDTLQSTSFDFPEGRQELLTGNNRMASTPVFCPCPSPEPPSADVSTLEPADLHKNDNTCLSSYESPSTSECYSVVSTDFTVCFIV